jgi:hypothetical protein
MLGSGEVIWDKTRHDESDALLVTAPVSRRTS